MGNETKNFDFCFAFRSLISNFDIRRNYFRSEMKKKNLIFFLHFAL